MSTFLGIDIFRYRKNMKRYNMTSLPAVIALKVVSKINTFLLISKSKHQKYWYINIFSKCTNTHHPHPDERCMISSSCSGIKKLFYCCVKVCLTLLFICFLILKKNKRYDMTSQYYAVLQTTHTRPLPHRTHRQKGRSFSKLLRDLHQHWQYWKQYQKSIHFLISYQSLINCYCDH